MRPALVFFPLSFAGEVEYAGIVGLLNERTCVLVIIVAIVTLSQMEEVGPYLL